MSSKQTPTGETDTAFQRWIRTITRKSTKKSYRRWFKCYIEFTGLTPSQLIDEALEDLRDPREKQDILMRRLMISCFV